MKILHTADWHLGKKLEQCERTAEQQDFLDWLIEKINAECVEVLIVAGDIFDTGTPSNTAQEQYYCFLAQVNNTCCREVVIIGGNHNLQSTGKTIGVISHIEALKDRIGTQIRVTKYAAGSSKFVVSSNGRVENPQLTEA